MAATKKTTDAAAETAKQNHPWQTRSGAEESSIHSDSPVLHGAEIIGTWGADDPESLHLELGTSHARAFPFLRPAADAHYPHYAGLIRASLI